MPLHDLIGYTNIDFTLAAASIFLSSSHCFPLLDRQLLLMVVELLYCSRIRQSSVHPTLAHLSRFHVFLFFNGSLDSLFIQHRSRSD